MDGPLAGVLVVALEQAVAAPLCTARLADAGARVIKIERREGDFARGYDHAVNGESAYFVWLNRGKESLALDLKDPDDARLLDNIVRRADVFVQNLAPGAADRAGFGSAKLCERDRRLIACDISGYGESGPYRQMKAYDLLIQCESGLASITGGVDEPGRVGVSVADICCGMNAHAGILQALYERERTGHGRRLAVSLFDGLADWMTVPLLQHQHTGRAPQRVGLSHPSIAPYGAYTTGDGRQTVLAVQNEREWRAFCAQVLLQPDLSTDTRFAANPLRCENRAALDECIARVLKQLTREQLQARLTVANVAFGQVNTVADLAVHPQLRRTEVATPSGMVSMPAPPVSWAEPLAAPGPVPALNEQGPALRNEFADRRT
jgi:crotonobetainyl-CoA:carnitine CoA-transferase CaiB-like acyl-CoA transferase